MKYAVQVYSVREHIKDEKTLLKALEEIKKIGYDGVEFAGYFGADAKKIKAKLDELGLVCVGGHIGLENFTKFNLEKTIEFQHILGTKAIGVGGAPHRTMVECKLTGKILGNAQKYAMEKYGMKVYYHNHTEEFKPLRNKMLPIDVIGSYCSLEIDTYWSFHAGIDNYKFLLEKKDNIVHLHVKDGIDGHPKALGEGNCDIPAVMKAAKKMGMEWLIVENDDPEPTGFEDIARSLKYLKSIDK
ncbi:MAG: sugar phosphate isomerase/epimerase [Clostridia bacterium]|nr:sugar phosphate isomerase/epimerase [Clostridia bacterium]